MEQSIGKYKVLREIGKGGMGIVYKGMDSKTQKVVAVKVLPASMVDRSMVERFHREVQAMAKVKHPNLVELYDFGMTQGQHFFAMEYVEGESLKTVIKNRGALPVSMVMQIARQVAMALTAIHREGMTHRDLKPGNIMIRSDGSVKLMDFGLVQIPGVTRVTAEGASLGTAEYMAPEQISDEGVDTRADIYSLGITMYEMLTSRPPFRGENFQATLMKHKYEMPPPLREFHPEISPELESVVMKAMSKDISRRYQKMDDIIEDLKKLGGQEIVPEKKTAAAVSSDQTEIVPPAQQETAQTVRRMRTPLKPIFLILMVGALGYGGYFYSGEIVSRALGFWDKLMSLGNSRSGRPATPSAGQGQSYEKADECYRLGRQYYAKGMVDKAIGEYKKAVWMRKEYILYYKDLAIAYEKKGDKQKALESWQMILKYGEGSTLAQNAGQEIERLNAE